MPTYTALRYKIPNWLGITEAMKYRTLGSTNLSISEIGFGAWGIGGAVAGNNSYGATSDECSLNALLAAKERGINFFDTSNIYGNGHSETLIGAAFKDCRQSVIISTKCGYDSFSEKMDFTQSNIETSLNNSLQRLQTDYVDLLQLHDPDSSLATNLELIDILKKQIKTGKVRFVGVSVKSPSHGLAFLNGPWQAIQCNFNLIDLRALDCGLFEQSQEKNVGLISRTPLAFGFLSGSFQSNSLQFSPGDHRLKWSKEQLLLWAKAGTFFSEVARKYNMSPTTLAIKFCLSFSQVSSVIPGMLNSDEVNENASASDFQSIEKDDLFSLLQISRSNNFFINQ